MITVAMADAYFAKHPKKTIWQALSYDDRESWLQMAQDDITFRIRIDEIDDTQTYQLKACYEQAIFLIENYDNLNKISKSSQHLSQESRFQGRWQFCLSRS